MPSKKKTAPKGPMTVHMVLDRSGSMQSCKDDTIGAFNEYVGALDPDTIFWLTIFDSQGIDTVISGEKASKVKKLDGDTYQPRASTPLYDAIGKTVTSLSEVKGDTKALVILTDGYENASREYTKDAIKKLLDEKQKAGWLVIYLGANQDAMAEGAKFGTKSANTMTFDQRAMRSTMASAARATTDYFAAGGGFHGQKLAAFTDAERSDAVDGGSAGIKSWVKPEVKKTANPWLKSDAEA